MSKRAPAPVPPRIAAKPDPAAWPEDALLTLPEAASLMWPTGLLTTKSLRHAQKTGQLATVTIAGKVFTNILSLRDLTRCGLVPPKSDDAQDDSGEPSFAELVQAKLASKKRIAT